MAAHSKAVKESVLSFLSYLLRHQHFLLLFLCQLLSGENKGGENVSFPRKALPLSPILFRALQGACWQLWFK